MTASWASAAPAAMSVAAASGAFDGSLAAAPVKA